MIYVSGFVKPCIVHISNFSTLDLETHKICYECQNKLKLTGFVKLLLLCYSSKFQNFMLFLPDSMNL